MTDETSKTRAVRGEQFEARYLRGRVIDIGCGPDIIVPHAEPFDLDDGDAQRIANLRPNGAYDAVCSSHCLEHMRDVPAALRQWWMLVRPGGHLILVVPDEDLYEQGGWPSLFNSDHKATFRLAKKESWSAVSFDIKELVQDLPGAQIVSCERQDQGYDYALRKRSISPLDRLLYRLSNYRTSMFRRLHLSRTALDRAVEGIFRIFGTPVDQTAGVSLAQIQIIARKAISTQERGEDAIREASVEDTGR
jgi:SAM-dependent methyltransferase